MALRHAVLAALLDGEFSGYELTKRFDVGVANFWYARPQQLYMELTKLESDELVSGREVAQEGRPNKRLFTITEAGLAELERFATEQAKPMFIRDGLLVKVYAIDRVDPAPVIAQLRERATAASGKMELFESIMHGLRGELDEETFLRTSPRIGPYLTCMRGYRYEHDSREWCLRTADALDARHSGDSGD